MSKLTPSQIATAIISGELDNGFDTIKSAIILRKRSLDSVLMNSLKVKDAVYFTESVRPKYLSGVKAIIVKVNRTRVQVRLAVPQGRFGGTINVPTSLITTIAP